MDNEELEGVKFSQFPSVTPGDSDEVVGLHAGDNARFTVANFVLAVRQGLANIFQAKITASGILKGDGQGGVSAATAGTDYQAPLTIDATPTANSTNPVQSGGVYTDVRTRVPVYGLGKNLLDNAYFVGGGSQLGDGVFPINHRGLTTYSGASQYSIDRWYKINCTVSVDSDGITLTRTNTEMLRQNYSSAFWKRLLGKTVTLAVWGADGLASSTFTLPSTLGSWDTTGPVLNGLVLDIYGNSSSDNGCGVRLYSASGTSWKLYAIKLELGTQQTLAHLEGSTWVLNEIPDYEEELIKCQTSPADSTDTYANKTLATEQQLAYVESGSTASRAYAVGEYFCWNGLLYRVKTAISSGGTFTPGTNCVQTTALSAIRLATASWTTGSGGTVSTGLNVSTAKILAAFAVGYDISVYLNASGVQGYFVKTAGTNNPAGNVTVSVTAVILNY